MTTLEDIAGAARRGTLYGIGVGPGDVRYLTLRAAGLVRSVDVIAYFGGLLYWYGYVMSQPDTPMWAWPFIPDCPLFGLLGGLGLLMVTARRYWSEAAQARGQRWLARLLRLPGLHWLAQRAYNLFARALYRWNRWRRHW